MASIRINEQLAFLRKQKGVTQEELAQVLGITNQSVSKWESGASCPDIALLPDIAAYFNVTTDALLGYKPAEDLSDVYLKIKEVFQQAPAEDSFDLAYRFASVLHEGAVSRGYKGFVPWDTGRNRSRDEDLYKWGFSACSEPEGASVLKGNAVFIASNKGARPITSNDIRNIHNALRRYEDIESLRVLFALYELTVSDFDVYVPLGDIAKKCRLPADTVETLLDSLPIEAKPLEDGSEGFRLEGGYMIMPAILSLLAW